VAAVRKPFKIEGALVVTDSATIGGLSFPTTDGTDGQVLTTDGNGNLTFTTVSGGGGGGGATNLADLNDVVLTGLTNGGLLQYDSANQRWVPSTQLDTPNDDQNVTTDGGFY